jgi:hypothetical protein
MGISVKPIVGQCWRPKTCHASIAAAEAEALRLTRVNRRRGDTRPLVVYYCPQHCNFHVGHQRQEARPEVTRASLS